MKTINYPAKLCLDDIQQLFHNKDNYDYDNEFNIIRNRLELCNLLEKQIKTIKESK